MTSKVVASAAPQDPKLPTLSTKEAIKAQGTSGNDEPTNSSSAEHPRPSLSNAKATKAPASGPGQETEMTEKPNEVQLNGTKSAQATGCAPPAATPKVFSVADLRKLARRPGQR